MVVAHVHLDSECRLRAQCEPLAAALLRLLAEDATRNSQDLWLDIHAGLHNRRSISFPL